MVILKQPYNRETVLTLAGIVDFACWKGIYYARKWPVTPRAHLTPNTLAQNAPYGYISQQGQTLDTATRDAYASMAVSTQQTWRDYQIQTFYGKSISLSAR